MLVFQNFTVNRKVKSLGISKLHCKPNAIVKNVGISKLYYKPVG